MAVAASTAAINAFVAAPCGTDPATSAARFAHAAMAAATTAGLVSGDEEVQHAITMHLREGHGDATAAAMRSLLQCVKDLAEETRGDARIECFSSQCVRLAAA
jgi:hypothetical protein